MNDLTGWHKHPGTVKRNGDCRPDCDYRDRPVYVVDPTNINLEITTAVLDAYRQAGPMEPDPRQIVLNVLDVLENSQNSV